MFAKLMSSGVGLTIPVECSYPSSFPALQKLAFRILRLPKERTVEVAPSRQWEAFRNQTSVRYACSGGASRPTLYSGRPWQICTVSLLRRSTIQKMKYLCCLGSCCSAASLFPHCRETWLSECTQTAQKRKKLHVCFGAGRSAARPVTATVRGGSRAGTVPLHPHLLK